MDDQQRLAFDGEIAYAVLGRDGEFALVQLYVARDEAVIAEARERGYRYCGVLAVIDGIPAARYDPDLDSVLCCFLASLKFAGLVSDRIQPAPKDDSVDFLTRLYALPDTRDERYLNIASRLRAMSPK